LASPAALGRGAALPGRSCLSLSCSVRQLGRCTERMYYWRRLERQPTVTRGREAPRTPLRSGFGLMAQGMVRYSVTAPAVLGMRSRLSLTWGPSLVPQMNWRRRLENTLIFVGTRS
jgi:hypothetical protein